MNDERTDEQEAQTFDGPSLPLSVHVIDRVSDETRRLENERRWRERRKNPRFALQVASYLQIDGYAGQSAAHVGDISIGGLFLKVDVNDVAYGVRVRLVLELPFFAGHRICTLNGRVVRVVPDETTGLGLGVEFDDGQVHDRQLLSDFLTLWARPAPR